MFDLTGKCALITGATGGIGGAIARALHAQGATVAISGRNEDKLNALKDELGDNVHVCPADLGNREDVDKLAKDAQGAMGRVDILVNNAGLTRDNLSMRMKDAEWDEVIEVNLTATFRLARAMQRGMMKNRFGRIINIASVVGVTGNPGQCNYTAAKAGMIGWSKSMATELAARGITVNCIAPGFIESAMTQELDEAQRQQILNQIPSGEMGAPDDIAAAAVYLASEQAKYVNGHTLHVNGGMAML